MTKKHLIIHPKVKIKTRDSIMVVKSTIGKAIHSFHMGEEKEKNDNRWEDKEEELTIP